MFRWVRVAAIGSGVLLAAMAYSATGAAAYDGYQAARYADAFALGGNYSTYRTFNDDCTNFVSQAMHYGGYSFMHTYGNVYDDHNWYMVGGPSSASWAHSWAVAAEFERFLYLDYPGGFVWGNTPGYNNPNYNNLAVGDVEFFDWSGHGGWTHDAMKVGTGTTDNGWYGDYVDEHTNNRQHAYWDLSPYNSQLYSTRIELVHVDARNQ